MSTTTTAHAGTRVSFVAAAFLLAIVFGPSLAAHVRQMVNPGVFNDDVRQQIYPLFRFTEDTVARDMSDDYQIALMPLGFQLLYRSVAPIVDPELLSRVLPYALLVAMFLGVTMAARHLGGPVVAFMALALALQTSVFLGRITGGMPRGFAFAFVSFGLWALVSGRPWALASLAVVAQCFYSVAAALLGLMLVALLFLVPRADRGEAAAWSGRRRVLLLVVVGALTSALAAPVSLAMSPWGRLLGPGDARVYPEIGPGGRFGEPDMMPVDRVPFPDFFVEALRQAALTLGSGNTVAPLIPRLRDAVRGRETMVTNVLLIILGLGLVPLARQSGAARRALVLPFAGLTGYVLATVCAPYLLVPQRYIAYTLPLFIVVFLPASGAALAGALGSARRAPWTRVVGVLLTAGASLVLLGGRGDPLAGYTIVLNPQAKIYEFVRSLPTDALIAGWPGGVIDNVPYVSRRRAFMTRENHLVFHEGYVLDMRRRMRALMTALYSDNARGLLELRDTFGVTHLIVETEYLSKPPPYLVPFDIEIAEIWQEGHSRGFAVETAFARAAVFSEGTLIVLELSRLS